MPLPFQLPPPPGATALPEWTGAGFRVGDRETPVLAYSVGTSGWSNELTKLHEAEAGSDHEIDRASRSHAVEMVSRWTAGANPVVMDIGCSSGFLLRELRAHLPGAVVLGADYVRGPLESLAGKAPDIPLLQFDLTACPLPDACLDAALLLNVLEHIEDDVAAMRQVARILKPGGVAVIEVPAGPGLYDVYDRVLMHHRRYKTAGLVKIVSAAGLQVASLSHLGFFLYPGFWLVKKRNQRYLTAPQDEQQRIVAANIRKTRDRALFGRLLRWESVLRKVIYLPFGIRCLLVARKASMAVNA